MNIENLEQTIRQVFEREQRTPEEKLMPGDVPRHYESITPEWLSDVLCDPGSGATVETITLDAPDDGSANRRRLFIKYNAAGAALGLPTSLFGKASQALQNRLMLAITNAIHNEVVFYNQIRGALELDIPRAYFAKYDPHSFNSIILLEDIGADVDFCDERTPINFEQAVSQIDFIADLHSAGTCENIDVSNLISYQDFWERTKIIGMEEYSQKGFLAAEAFIPDRLFARFDEIWPATERSVMLNGQAAPCILHGDCHVKQWYSRGNQMGLTDWQACSTGGWGHDFATVVATSLTTDNRRAWERELLVRYLDRRKFSHGQKPNFDDAFLTYRRDLVHAMAHWTITLTPSPQQPDMQPQEAATELIARLATAIDDLDAVDSCLSVTA